MDQDNGWNRCFAVWQQQTSGKFDLVVVKLDGEFLEAGFRRGFISMGLGAAMPIKNAMTCDADGAGLPLAEGGESATYPSTPSSAGKASRQAIRGRDGRRATQDFAFRRRGAM